MQPKRMGARMWRQELKARVEDRKWRQEVEAGGEDRRWSQQEVPGRHCSSVCPLDLLASGGYRSRTYLTSLHSGYLMNHN